MLFEKNSPLLTRKNSAEKYRKVFIAAFAILLIIFLPLIIYNKGYFTYYGDFNSQQIPFYYHCADFIKNGSLGWDWQTDLGSNFIGSYAFYLLGSPFFWFASLFPLKVIPYLMSILLCLKHAIAATLAYAYIRRFVRSKDAAFVGGLLYAFSGFQTYNIFFNHFQDVTAFFPLLLIAIEERVNNDRRGFFALSVALMAIINYFFFTGQIVFVFIYFIIRCFCKDFKITWRKFFSIAFESIIGFMMSLFILLPAILAITSNYRVSSHASGLELVIYNDKTIIWRVIQSFFMIPDAPARPNLFNSDNSKWASIGGYLPLISMAGVLAFMKTKKKHWASKMILICTICAFVPALNSAFYAFNSSYYARWFYMPILIMAMMSAYAIDNYEVDIKHGIKISAIMLGVFGVISILPKKNSDNEIEWFNFASNMPYFYITLAISVIGLIAFSILMIYRKKNGSGADFRKRLVCYFMAGCIASTAAVFYFGISIGSEPRTYIDRAINGGEKVDLPQNDGEFYRIDISENYDNYPMFWGYSNMRAFQSIVPASVMNFYNEIGCERNVASRAETSYYSLRGLLSVKYYFENIDDDAVNELVGFEQINTQNGFKVYKNQYYIPMGFTYDYYFTEEQAEAKTDSAVSNLFVKALLLSDKQIEKYSDIIEPVSDDEAYNLTDDSYIQWCKKHIENSCSEFNYNSKGFDAKISLESDKLVFFSVPYDDGWTAYVNGKKADIETVDNGLMAVKAYSGDNTIEFKYETPGLKYGIIISIAGLVILITYLGVIRITKTKIKPSHTHYYDYPDSNIYAQVKTDTVAQNIKNEASSSDKDNEKTS